MKSIDFRTNWISDFLPIGSLWLETSATALCGPYVMIIAYWCILKYLFDTCILTQSCRCCLTLHLTVITSFSTSLISRNWPPPAIDRLSLTAEQLLGDFYGTLLKLGLLHINLTAKVYQLWRRCKRQAPIFSSQRIHPGQQHKHIQTLWYRYLSCQTPQEGSTWLHF